ncbi:MAG: DUF4293 domain-containing protein [Bacteroidota bacterium]
MIQRIQTLFLLLSAITLGLFLWLPLIAVENVSFKDSIQGWQIGHTLPLSDIPYIIFLNAILAGTAFGFTILNIFLFKKRSVQMLFCWFAILLIVSAEGFVYYKYQTKIFIGDVLLTPWNILAIVAVILQILAFVFIRKDEELVKSLDRLR